MPQYFKGCKPDTHDERDYKFGAVRHLLLARMGIDAATLPATIDLRPCCSAYWTDSRQFVSDQWVAVK